MSLSAYESLQGQLRERPRTWLVTGVAGFIGSNLLEALLRLDQRVVGLDNFATGSTANLEDVRAVVGDTAWSGFTFLEGDLRSLETCRQAVTGVDFVLHQAALGSVPRSVADPLASHQANVDGFLNMLLAARDEKVQRLIYASSSSVYGDHPDLPKVESRIGLPLSPYALTKSINEQYARIFALTWGFKPIGLRYFNVFGPRQKKDGPYAAVIPKWITGLMLGETCTIHGDGETSRDFCYVANAVQANLLAAATTREDAEGVVFNVACGARTSLRDLYLLILERIESRLDLRAPQAVEFGPFRMGDMRHSLADINLIQQLLEYDPSYTISRGLNETVDWFIKNK